MKKRTTPQDRTGTIGVTAALADLSEPSNSMALTGQLAPPVELPELPRAARALGADSTPATAVSKKPASAVTNFVNDAFLYETGTVDDDESRSFRSPVSEDAATERTLQALETYSASQGISPRSRLPSLSSMLPPFDPKGQSAVARRGHGDEARSRALSPIGEAMHSSDPDVGPPSPKVPTTGPVLDIKALERLRNAQSAIQQSLQAIAAPVAASDVPIRTGVSFGATDTENSVLERLNNTISGTKSLKSTQSIFLESGLIGNATANTKQLEALITAVNDAQHLLGEVNQLMAGAPESPGGVAVDKKTNDFWERVKSARAVDTQDSSEIGVDFHVPSESSSRAFKSRRSDKMAPAHRQDSKFDGQAHYMQQCNLMSQDEAEASRARETRALKRIYIRPIPIVLLLAFMAAAGFYAFSRVAYGMENLGKLIPYSVVLLVIEMMGAISMLFYGCWLIAAPNNCDIVEAIKAAEDFCKPEKLVKFEQQSQLAADSEIGAIVTEGEVAPEALSSAQDTRGASCFGFRRNYVLRVMVPCYKESLPIVQRTVLAARRADRPVGTRVIIYLCDDGSDDKKKEWIASLNDRDVVYVTGRDKSKRALNGKSENLNHSLRLIYPDIKDPASPDKLKVIPLEEVMLLFDADQTCSKNAITTLLRYIDSGDDVGVALSPQLMHNIVPDSDIFNHQNVHFWEMMQPGMDALGFISLTGTNMVMRARALRDCGWFPTNSVTEDWALGMAFKKKGWRCRYVCEYLAIGEGPLEVRNAFQQRSRWSKGHYQVFWSKDCPLIDSRLNLFYKLAYSSTCLTYLSAGLSVPILAAVPILTLLFGIFPITLNIHMVFAITLYYGTFNALAFHCSSFKYYKALWLSQISATILWYPYLKASIFTPYKQLRGKAMVFKTTLKGSGAASAGFRTLGPSGIIVLLNITALITGLATLNFQINAPKVISLFWVIFNSIPHIILLVYSQTGQGSFLTWFNRTCMVVGFLASTGAVLSMWFLYPREVDYKPVAVAAIRFLQAEQSGALPSDWPVKWRFTSGIQNKLVNVSSAGTRQTDAMGQLQELMPFELTISDLSGGFYNDGLTGPVKLTKSSALSTSMLAWSLLDAPDAYMSDDNLQQNALDLLEHGVQYMLACYIPDPTGVGSRLGDVLVAAVGDADVESLLWRRPEDITEVQSVKLALAMDPNGPSDLAGQMSAALTSASLALLKYARWDTPQAMQTISVAHDLFNVSMNTTGVWVGAYDFYPSDSFFDDRMWAASWLYRASLEEFGTEADNALYYQALFDSYYLAIAEEDVLAVNMNYMTNVALVHAATLLWTWEMNGPAQSFVYDWLCSSDVKYTPTGRAFVASSPKTGDGVTAAALAQIYANKMKYWSQSSSQLLGGFECYAQAQARYYLGSDLNRRSYTIGMNADTFSVTMHHGASCPAWPEPCTGKALLKTNEPDANEITGALVWNPFFSDSSHNSRDNVTAVSLENNWGLPLLASALVAKSEAWTKCLMFRGPWLPDPICSRGRPVRERTGLTKRKKFWGRDALKLMRTPPAAPPPGRVTLKMPLPRKQVPLGNITVDPALWDYNLSSLLGQSWQFYEAQRSGKLPRDNMVPWRGDSYLRDGEEALPLPLDLEGGWYDAGDTLKLSFPLCTSIWRLATSLITYKQAHVNTTSGGRMNYLNALRQLNWISTYLIKLHPAPLQFVVQVGNFTYDHLLEPGKPLVPEQYDASNTRRPVLLMNDTLPGSDMAAEAAAAYASLSILFFESNATLSIALEQHARDMYKWSMQTIGTRYSDIHPDLAAAYKSSDPYAHTLVAAAWMYKLTNEATFLADAKSLVSKVRLSEATIANWANPFYDACIMMAELDPSTATWLGPVTKVVEAAMFAGIGMSYTRKGLLFVDAWGSLRNAASIAHVALRAAAVTDAAADQFIGVDKSSFSRNVVWAQYARCFARQQMNYIYGSTGRSFVTSWGKNPPTRPHHRGASCAFVLTGAPCDGDTFLNADLVFPNVLTSALVGGPSSSDVYVDSHLDYVKSEVAVDYNAALITATAGIMSLPDHFWKLTAYCENYPIPAINFNKVNYQS